MVSGIGRRGALALLSALSLAGCNSQDDVTEVPIVRPTSVAPAGIYTGVRTSSLSGEITEITAFLSNQPGADGKARVLFFNSDGTQIASGLYMKVDDARRVSWTMRLFTPAPPVVEEPEPEEPEEPVLPPVDPAPVTAITPVAPVTPPVTTPVAPVAVAKADTVEEPEEDPPTTLVSILSAQGAFSAEQEILLSYNVVDSTTAARIDEGNLTLDYEEIAYESRSAPDLIQGTWGKNDPFGVPLLNFSVSADGRVSGTDFSVIPNCIYSGSFVAFDQHYNLYNVELNRQCGAETAVFQGLMTRRPSTTNNLPATLTVVGASATQGLLLKLTRQ